MTFQKRSNRHAWLGLAAALAVTAQVEAAPTVSRLTPPSELFASGNASPMISRFIPGQRFDLQATIRPDAGQTITGVQFQVDGVPVPGSVGLVTTGLVSGLPAGTTVASLRAYANSSPGAHTLSVVATQSDSQTVSRSGNFEVVGITQNGRRARNIIVMLGDGMGSGHRTAARIMLNGVAQGKAKAKLAMDTFPVTASIMTSSLNSIVTDSAPGMQNYVTGNKSANNQEGVWPDDTTAAFDNPRIEYMSEFLARTQGKKLGVVTTSDVFDATPASMAIHTQARGNGTGIVDQFFDDRAATGLTVLMGGGRKWFLPNPTTCTGAVPACGDAGSTANFNGSARANGSDYLLPADVVSGWGASAGALDAGRDLVTDFTSAGWAYASDATSMASAPVNQPLLGLFALSQMNVALDKIDGRRSASTLVDDYGFPDQPMLDEMTAKALEVLDANSPNGFVLMVEAASIDKQAHNMDTERFILDTIEFDRAIALAKQYAQTHPDTLVLVTADHECAGVAVIGASMVTDTALQALNGLPLRDSVVGLYEGAGFPIYTIASDGYPVSTNVDRRMLVGYASNADRYEDWRTNPQPIRDGQQPGNGVLPLSGYPTGPLNRDVAGNLLLTGQIPGTSAAHTANDIPLSAYGRGASLIGGTMDNTDVFFSVMQAVIGGAK